MLLKFGQLFRQRRTAYKNRVAEIQQLETRSLPASSTVAVVQTGMNLTLTGDNKGNDVRVEVNDSGVTITAYYGTSLKFNGVADDDGAITISVPDGVAIGAVIVNLKGGIDYLKVDVAPGLGTQSIKSLSVDTGDEGDTVQVFVGYETTLNFTDGVSLLTGEGEDHIEVTLDEATECLAKTLTVNSGPDSDKVSVTVDGRLTVTGAVSFLTGDGNDDLAIGVEYGGGSATFGNTFTINTGEDRDFVDMDFGDTGGLTVKGLTTITTDDGDDRVRIFNENSTLNFLKGLTVNTGTGADSVIIAGAAIGYEVTGGGVLHVAGADLVINTGSGEDDVSIVSKLALDLGLNITTGDGRDDVAITTDAGITESEEATAPVANFIKGNLSIDTGSDYDDVKLLVPSTTSLSVNGKAAMTTADGGDRVMILNENSTLNFLKGLTVNTGTEADSVTIAGTVEKNDSQEIVGLTGGGVLHVAGADLVINTGSGWDDVSIVSKLALDLGLNITTGDGQDYVTITTDAGITESEEATAPVANFIKGNLSIDTGSDYDDVKLLVPSTTSLSVNGTAAMTTADGFDRVRIFNENSTLNFLKGLTVNTGTGADSVIIAGAVIGYEVTGGGVLHVAGADLVINTGSEGDDVEIFSQLALDLGLNITTGDDQDYVTITTDAGITESEDATAPVANFIKGNLNIDTGSDGDDVKLLVPSTTSLSVNGTAAMTTADGGDRVMILNENSTLNFLKGLTVNTGTGADSVIIAGAVIGYEVTGGGVLHVAGADLVINTGSGRDAVEIFSKLALDLGLNITTGDDEDRITITTDVGITESSDTPVTVANLIRGNLNIDTGDDNDGVMLVVQSATTLSVNGTASIKTGLGDDAAVVIHLETTLSFLKGLTIDTGSTTAMASGKDQVNITGGKLNVTGILKINTGAMADDVAIIGALAVTGDVNIDSGTGHDGVAFNFESGLGTPGAGAANTLGSLTVNSGSGSDYVDITNLEGGTVQIGGNVSLTTGTGLDIVTLYAFANFTIVKDLNIDTGSGDDQVGVMAVQGSIRVNGSEKILLGDDDDCFIQGTATTTDDFRDPLVYEFEYEPYLFGAGDPEATFQVDLNVSVQGAAGDDFIGLAGVQIGKDKPTPTSALPASLTTLDLGTGDDLVEAFGVNFRDLKIIGGPATGDGNDQISVIDSTFRGTTNIDLGSGNDNLNIYDSSIGDNVTVLGGAGNDGLGIISVGLADGKKLTLNGGVGTNSRLFEDFPFGESDFPASAFSTPPINWPEGEFDFESTQALIDASFSSFLYDIEESR